jgi:GyrI-like small molecule binding protein
MTPRLEERAERPYLAIACRVTDGVPAAVDPAFPALFGWLRDHAIAPAGPPLIRYLTLDAGGDPLEIEVCAPVAAGTAGDERVRAGVVPAGRYAALLHVGPYRHETVPDLAAAREVLQTFVAAHGLAYARPDGSRLLLPCALEEFRIGPVEERDWTRWETELAFLVAEAP